MGIDWNSVDARHVHAAINRYESGERPVRDARNTFLLINGRRHPAKFIRGMAYEEANGRKLDPSQDYSGGDETARHLTSLGFQIEYQGKIYTNHFLDSSCGSSELKPFWKQESTLPDKQPRESCSNASGLKLALVVQDTSLVQDANFETVDNKCFQFDALEELSNRGEVDLVVFPEQFIRLQRDEDSISIVKRWAERLGVPVLMGVKTKDGFQTAVYSNPYPKQGETESHRYVKHSSAEKLAYDWPGYGGPSDAMFTPIALNGEKIAVVICHDMFFGLMCQRYRQMGATAYIDLTGGNVNIRKWTNVVKARSIELNAPFVCTMGFDRTKNGKSQAIAFSKGRQLTPFCEKKGKDGVTGFGIFQLAQSDTRLVQEKQSFSNRSYDDIVVALGSSSPTAHLGIKLTNGKPIFSGRNASHHQQRNSWDEFNIRISNEINEKLGVLLLPLELLRDGLALYRYIVPKGTFKHFMVIYYSDVTPDEPEETLCLMSMKAIEHRIAVGLLAGEQRELLKTIHPGFLWVVEAG